MRKEDMMFAPKKILVPTDFSESSDTALKKALDIAYQYKATIYLLHVIDDKLYQGALLGIGRSDIIEQREEESIRYAQEKLQEQLDAYALAKKFEIVSEIQIGLLPDVIMKKQQEKGIDFMVIGAHKKEVWFSDS